VQGYHLHLFHTSSSHSLEAALVSFVDLWHLEAIFLELLDKLVGIELAIASTGFDDLGLLF